MVEHKPFPLMTKEELNNLTPELYKEMNEYIEEMQIFDSWDKYFTDGIDSFVIHYGEEASIIIEHDGYIYGCILIGDMKTGSYKFVENVKLLDSKKITSISIVDDNGNTKQEYIDNFEERIKEYTNSIGLKL